MSRSRDHRLVDLHRPTRAPARRTWRPADVVALVVAVCYGEATLLLALATFLRLVP